eukprot:1156676-Pelagomonas_calceolata.AAC.4
MVSDTILPGECSSTVSKGPLGAGLASMDIGSADRGVIYIPHTLEPPKELGLDTYKATRLAQKLRACSVQYAYKLASTRRALEKTPFDSHQQDQARATASNPPDPH